MIIATSGFDSAIWFQNSNFQAPEKLQFIKRQKENTQVELFWVLGFVIWSFLATASINTALQRGDTGHEGSRLNGFLDSTARHLAEARC